jgi:hypothetical protein
MANDDRVGIVVALHHICQLEDKAGHSPRRAFQEPTVQQVDQ